MNRKLLCIAIIILSIVIAVIGFIVLPDIVVMQLRMDGHTTNSMPKAVAVLISWALTAGGAVWQLFMKGEEKSKALSVSVIGIVVSIVTIIMNLTIFK